MREIRWLLAEMLLGWVVSLVPQDEGGRDFLCTIKPFFERQLARAQGGGDDA